MDARETGQRTDRHRAASARAATQGYLTDMGNLVALAAFQGPVNLVAVWVGAWAASQGAGTQARPEGGGT